MKLTKDYLEELLQVWEVTAFTPEQIDRNVWASSEVDGATNFCEFLIRELGLTDEVENG
jgi:hypothetical protein